MNIRTKIVFTVHAESRLGECQLTRAEVQKLLEESTEVKPDKNVRKYKQEKYNGNKGVVYYENGPIIFTTRWCIDRFTYKPLLLVITVTNRLVTIRI